MKLSLKHPIIFLKYVSNVVKFSYSNKGMWVFLKIRNACIDEL